MVVVSDAPCRSDGADAPATNQGRATKAVRDEVARASRNGRRIEPELYLGAGNFSEMSGAVGLKLNLFEELLVDFNLLFKLDDNGLRDKITPLLGLEYGL